MTVINAPFTDYLIRFKTDKNEFPFLEIVGYRMDIGSILLDLLRSN
jgi:hypothetical protein